MEDCDFCGEAGHHWSTHPEARADVDAHAREAARADFPFGDHRGAL